MSEGEAMVWVVATAISREVHIDTKHGFPEGYTVVHFAKTLLDALDAAGLEVVWTAERAERNTRLYEALQEALGDA